MNCVNDYKKKHNNILIYIYIYIYIKVHIVNNKIPFQFI